MNSKDITNDVAQRLSQPTAIERRMSENAAYRKACRRELYELMSLIEEVVFPAFFGELPLEDAVSRIRKIVRHQATEIRLGDEATIADVADRFIERLPDIKHSVLEDVEAVAKIDPAVTDLSEIIVSYPAVKAMLHYRTANTFVRLNVPIIPRIITEMAHSATGIDIHPAATIGRRFAIDHGTGIVIGATTIVGDNVTLYQGVTLGAKNFTYGDDGLPLDIP
ncbi:MAG: serine acetyltransferase, partial [Muribaculaceae bacterium]|nr:serine acetyltransferase [Muribaculaceae bacterium]